MLIFLCFYNSISGFYYFVKQDYICELYMAQLPHAPSFMSLCVRDFRCYP